MPYFMQCVFTDLNINEPDSRWAKYVEENVLNTFSVQAQEVL